MSVTASSVPESLRLSPAWRLFQEGGLATSYVPMDTPEATTVAAALFGLQGRLLRFDTEKDDTFRIDTAEGQRYVLKIANPFEPVDEIDLQLQALMHIQKHDPALPVPRVLAARDGSLLSTFTDRAGQVRRARLLSFVKGTPLDSLEATALQRGYVGEMLARLRLALQDFSHPSDARALAWDVKHLPTLEPLLQGVHDTNHRRLLERGLERQAEIQPRLAGLRSQVLHNDFSKSNIVADPAHPTFVTGIIDFGDVVRTVIAIDVSTALLNQLPRSTRLAPDTDLFAQGRDVLRGYLRVADLTEEELSVVPHLTMARVITRALLTTWRARMFPDNARYILRNTGPGWAQLEWFLARPTEQISALLTARTQNKSTTHPVNSFQESP